MVMLYFLNNWIVMTFIYVSASCFPKQLRGPALNVSQVYGAWILSFPY